MLYRLIESLIATAALGIFVCATLGSAAQSSTPRNVLLALSKRNTRWPLLIRLHSRSSRVCPWGRTHMR
jgi:hypothetical protein